MATKPLNVTQRWMQDMSAVRSLNELIEYHKLGRFSPVDAITIHGLKAMRERILSYYNN